MKNGYRNRREFLKIQRAGVCLLMLGSFMLKGCGSSDAPSGFPPPSPGPGMSVHPVMAGVSSPYAIRFDGTGNFLLFGSYADPPRQSAVNVIQVDPLPEPYTFGDPVKSSGAMTMDTLQAMVYAGSGPGEDGGIYRIRWTPSGFETEKFAQGEDFLPRIVSIVLAPDTPLLPSPHVAAPALLIPPLSQLGLRTT